MKKILAAFVVAIILGLPTPAHATRSLPTTQYRCDPVSKALTHTRICRLQSRKCTVVGYRHHRPIRHCTPWRYVAWAR